ncbi:MAG TPA: glutathione S-transferase family protein [Kofleriaceae bacterium]|nr:glutathione S-transferase family protein [Kofleriaceae bacterium]
MTARLVTIPFSHFCEKARWALDRAGVAYTEEGHLPLFHFLPARLAGGGRTVPVLVADGTSIADSTEIVAWADAHAPGMLLPPDPVDRSAALELEDDFDRQLGPATRRWAYFQLLPRKDLLASLLRGVPRWETVAFTATRPLATLMLTRALKIDAAGAARSRQKIDDTFARVSALVADGRRFLVGNRFTVADLTFAALAAPVVLPPAYGASLPKLSEFPDEPRASIEAWRASPAGQLALRIYETERGSRPAAS